jgi:hypothetical protein
MDDDDDAEVPMMARQHDDHAETEPERDPAEGFGGEVTPVMPDGSATSHWDRDAEDEDSLVRHDPRPGEDAAGR